MIEYWEGSVKLSRKKGKQKESRNDVNTVTRQKIKVQIEREEEMGWDIGRERSGVER